MNRLFLRRLSAALLAGLVGFAINGLPFANVVRLWPGRVVTLPVAIFLGPGFGALSALLAAPAAFQFDRALLAVFTLEAVAVGAFARRGKPPLVAAALVAISFALSVALFPAFYDLASLQSSIVPLALQRLLNVLIAPVVADFVCAAISTDRRVRARLGVRRLGLRAHFFHAFVLVAILPVLLLSTTSSQVFATKQETEGAERLRESASALAGRIDAYLDMHVHAVEALAQTVSEIGNDQVSREQSLKRYAQIYPGFHGLAIDDIDGWVRHILLLANGVVAQGRLSVADRQFFKDAIAGRRSSISDIVMTRTFPSEPSVFIGAPLPGPDGAPVGAVHVSLNLSQFQQFVEDHQTLSDVTVTILDRHNRVIYSTGGTDYRLQQDVSQSPLVMARPRTSKGVYEYTPTGSRGVSSPQLAADASIDRAGWTVFVSRPLVNLRLQTPAYYVSTLTLILIALVGAIIGARAFAETVTRPLEELVAIVRNVSAQGTPSLASLSSNPPAEIARLVDDVNGMQTRLSDSYRQLEQALVDRGRLNQDLRELTGQLDRKVKERTAELADANAVLHDVFRALPGALLVCDDAQSVRLFNDTALTLLERSAAELDGLPMTDVFDVSDPLPIAEIAALTSRGDVFRAEKIIVTKRGERVPTLVSATVLQQRTAGVADLRTICIAIDITDRKKLERELHQAQKLESVGRLAAGVAHEINTPVQFVSDSIHFVRDAMGDLGQLIQVYRGLLSPADLAQAQADEVARAEREADLEYLLDNVPKAIDRSLEGLNRVAVIVRSMKEFAHPDQRDMTSIDLNQAIQSTLVIARHEYKYVADVELHLGDIPRVTCHVGDINQVVLNIIVNAAHAIADVVKGTGKKGSITVETRHDGDSVVVSITDTGGGIPEAIRDQIFDPFFTTKGVGRGTGQGLALARSTILEKHGGALTFETAIGEGTTFIIRLPVDGRLRAGIAA